MTKAQIRMLREEGSRRADTEFLPLHYAEEEKNRNWKPSSLVYFTAAIPQAGFNLVLGATRVRGKELVTLGLVITRD